MGRPMVEMGPNRKTGRRRLMNGTGGPGPFGGVGVARLPRSAYGCASDEVTRDFRGPVTGEDPLVAFVGVELSMQPERGGVAREHLMRLGAHLPLSASELVYPPRLSL